MYLKSDVELGGTDQRFNIMMGRDLQRAWDIEPQVALFMPLLVGTDGVEKMSKSKNNAVGIDEAPSEMFGKVMSISDELMSNWYELCTDVPMDEVAVLCDGAKSHLGQTKRRLAREIIAIYHGQEAAVEAEQRFDIQFKQHQVPDDIPTFTITADLKDAEGKVRLTQLITAAKLAPSGGEAKRLIKEAAVTVDGVKIEDISATIEVVSGQVLKVGKRGYARLEV